MADARRAALKDRTDVTGARARIVEARVYDDIQDALLEGAGARERTKQGRRRRARGTRDAAHQAPAESVTMAERKPAPDKKANRRGAARLAAVQALYQMDIAGAGLNDIFAEFESHWLGGEVEGEKYLPAEAAFFRDVVSGVVRDQSKLDPLIDEALSKGDRKSTR